MESRPALTGNTRKTQRNKCWPSVQVRVYAERLESVCPAQPTFMQ